MANLSEGSVARQQVPLPGLAEQKLIVDLAEVKSRHIDFAISRLGNEIVLLNEYRTRLIADVVTGKLDVRRAAAGLPEEIEPLDVGEPGNEIEKIEPDDDEEIELS